MKSLSRIAAIITSAIILLTGCSISKTENNTEKFIKLSSTGSDYTITESGIYNISGVMSGGKVLVETNGDVTLILSGVDITNSDDEAIKIKNEGTTTIRTSSGTVNTLSGGGDASINAKSSIVFEGSGTLNINGTQKHGIESDGDITINSGTINVNSFEHGIKSESIITILGGNINIVAETGKGIKAEKEFLAEDGNVTINSIENEGLESKGALTINGGTFDITAGEDGINAGTSDSTAEASSADESLDESAVHLAPDYTDAITEGGEGTGAVSPEDAQPDRFRPEGGFPMGGEGEPTNPDADASGNTERPQRPEKPMGDIPPSDFVVPDGATSSGRGVPFDYERQKGGFGGGPGRINEDSVLTINGGTIRINCLGDGIDSNGTLTINGGTVIIDGPENSGNGPLDSDGEMIINGATVLTASSRGMTQMPRSMTQGILNINFDSALSQGDEIVIMDTNDKIIAEHKVGRMCEMLIYTSPDIVFDEAYTVYVNGNEHSSVAVSNDFSDGFGPIRGGNGKFSKSVQPPKETDSDNE